MSSSTPRHIQPTSICRWRPTSDSLNLTGFANWMKVQTREELLHAQKFFDYINERGVALSCRRCIY